jgi:hypothetical protein
MIQREARELVEIGLKKKGLPPESADLANDIRLRTTIVVVESKVEDSAR